MRKLKCENCGEVFREEDADTQQECVGDFWGSPAYMYYNACPTCGSTDLEETSDDEEDEE